MAAVPYKNSDQSKKGQVEDMFDNISHRYDFLNHLLSFNIDRLWRRKAVKLLKPYAPEKILDVATGTADFAIAAARLSPEKITGIDISGGMIDAGRKKIEKKGLNNLIELIKADSENIPFDDNIFDSAIVGFGVRNFENLEKGLKEIKRVLKPGGVFMVLEFSIPRNRLFRAVYFFYFLKLVPWLGRLISKDTDAYTYLPESVREFPDGERFLGVLENTGFKNCKSVPLTLGIAAIYMSEKPENREQIQ